MAEKTKAQGHVLEWVPSADGKPGKGIIGGYAFSIFPKEYGKDEDNAVYADLVAAVGTGNPIRASLYQNAKGYYSLDDFSDRVDEEAVVEGDKKSEETKSKPRGNKPFTPRDESWQAARWALSSALETVPGADLTDKDTQKKVKLAADWLAKASQDLAGKLRAPKGPANSAADLPKEVKEEVPF